MILGMRLLAIGVLAVVLVPAGAAQQRRAPALRVVDWAPFTVRGSGFAAGEKVQLTLRTGRPRAIVRTTSATGDGTFRAGFGLVAVAPCHGTLSVTARGSRGSRASLKQPCRPPSVER